MQGLELDFDVNPCFHPLYTDNQRIFFLLMGGRGRGASYALAQKVVFTAMSEPEAKILLVRYTNESIQDSIWAEVNKVVDDYKLNRYVSQKENRAMRMILNGVQIVSKGFRQADKSNTAKMKSLASFNRVFIEEGDEIEDEEEFNRFYTSIRPRKDKKTGKFVIPKFYFASNPPIMDHWIVKRYFDLKPAQVAKELNVSVKYYTPKLKPKYKDTVKFITGSWKTNDFWKKEVLEGGKQQYYIINGLDPDSENVSRYHHKKAEEYALKYLQNQAYDKYEYYKDSDVEAIREQYLRDTLGLIPSQNVGLIYKDWKPITLEEYNSVNIRPIYGLDFGFRDPTTLIEVKFNGDDVFVDEMFYEPNLKIDAILTYIITKVKDPTRQKIYADHKPEFVEQLKETLPNILMAKKGNDSVIASIELLKTKRVHYTKRSKNIEHEYNRYAYSNKKVGSRYKPIDKYNHTMDAIRMAVHSASVNIGQTGSGSWLDFQAQKQKIHFIT